jgi:hypothetical protein
MNADSATSIANPVSEVASWRRFDPVRARVTANSQTVLADAAWRPDNTPQGRRQIHLLSETRNPRPRRPHPGDVLYWIACVGGACVLLLCATL